MTTGRHEEDKMSQPDSSSSGQINPIVFYDGGCPLCRREINHYRRLDRQCSIDWVDITRQPQLLERYGLTSEQAMQRLHVLDQSKHWHTGSDGFALLWSRLPGYRWFTAFLKRTGLLRLLEPWYNRFARWRHKRRSLG